MSLPGSPWAGSSLRATLRHTRYDAAAPACGWAAAAASAAAGIPAPAAPRVGCQGAATRGGRLAPATAPTAHDRRLNVAPRRVLHRVPVDARGDVRRGQRGVARPARVRMARELAQRRAHARYLS